MSERVTTMNDLTWKPDANGVTILGYDSDGVWHDVIDAHDCGPEWLARRLNMAKALSDAPVVEVRRVGTTIIEIEPVVFHVEPGKYRLVRLEDDHG